MTRDTVVVVGAAGFLGQACTKALVSAGMAVDGVDVVEVSIPGVKSWTVADVMRGGVPEGLLAEAGTLINFAWRNDPGRGNANMAHDVQTNVAAAVRSFEQAARAGVRRIIYPSSGGTIYGDDPPLPTPETAPIRPVGGYGAGKAAAELYLHAIALAHGTQTCALRIGNPYGPGQYPERGQGFVATAVARTLLGTPIQIFGSAALARDYVYVEDVAEAFVRAVTIDEPPAVLNLGSGIDRSLEELIPLIFAAAGRETKIEFVPARRVDVPRVQLDISLIQQSLGWRPTTSIAEGLRRTVEWIRNVALAANAD
jgi:UDP-glucose 4-epimerase